MVNYFISGVWFKDNDINRPITHVFLHPVDEKGDFGKGTRRSEAQVVALINRGAVIRTLRYNYNTRFWNVGALVEVIPKATRSPFLRTEKDHSVSDNLANLIDMDALFSII